MSDQDLKDDAYWQQSLSDEDYRICRQKGTERPFTGEYWDVKTKGTYLCKCCSQALFESDTKFDSGTGWPSFYQPAKAGSVAEHTDSTLGMSRTEVVCEKCGSHLGHVFPDGPGPTGLRYCINSASLQLDESDKPEFT